MYTPLAFLEEFKYEEVAEILSVGVSTVEVSFPIKGACTVDFTPMMSNHNLVSSFLTDPLTFANPQIVNGTLTWERDGCTVDISPEWIYNEATLTRGC